MTTRPRVLIIDHEDEAREAIRRALEEIDIQVTSVAGGRIAMNLYRTQDFDMVITELLMPECDGLEIIMDLRKQKPTTKIIAISGGGQTGMYHMLSVAEKLGAHRSLFKPFSPRQMLKTVSEVLAETESAPQ